MIPNTTPTPNELYNGEMKKMNDTELRVVLLVTRSTLGWEIDHKTGMRKIEDWISHSQIIEKTGRTSPVISRAINNCVEQGWIETRDKYGNLLLNSEKRRRRKVFYRLGEIFLGKISTLESKVDKNKSTLESKVDEKKSTYESKVNLPKKRRNTKSIIQNQYYNNTYSIIISKKSERKDQDIFEIINLFKSINPSYEKFFKNRTQRAAAERLIKSQGKGQLVKIINILNKTNGMNYAPTITTPLELEDKLGKLSSFLRRKKNEIIKKPTVAKIK